MRTRPRAATVGSVAFAIALAAPLAASAHLLRVVPPTGTVAVGDPEVSQAFYGELEGEPARFSFVADRPFAFRAAVLSPDIPGADKDFSISVMQDGKPWKLASAGDASWSRSYEPYAGDAYFEGPRIEAEAPAGSYEIAVFSPDNLGKYVFTVGDRESFLPADLLGTIASLPALKVDYFGKPWYSAFLNRIGLFLALGAVVTATAVALAAWLAMRAIRRRMRPKPPRFRGRRGTGHAHDS